MQCLISYKCIHKNWGRGCLVLKCKGSVFAIHFRVKGSVNKFLMGFASFNNLIMVFVLTASSLTVAELALGSTLS